MQMGQSGEHGRLSPVKGRCLIRYQWILTKIEESLFILQMVDCPLGYFLCQVQGIGMIIF